jgi:hypothetical protein
MHTVLADASHHPDEQVPGRGASSRARRGRRAPQRKFHAEDPGDPSRCTCGYLYPAQCRGGHPILPAATRDAITSRVAAGVPFAQIAEQTGVSLYTVRRVVHG